MAVAAGMLLARIEAKQEAGCSMEVVLRQALLTAVEEKQVGCTQPQHACILVSAAQPQ